MNLTTYTAILKSMYLTNRGNLNFLSAKCSKYQELVSDLFNGFYTYINLLH